MEHENAFGTGPVRCVSASTYLRLRFLDSHAVAQEVRPPALLPALLPATPSGAVPVGPAGLAMLGHAA
jgi:hypothetical protein